MNRLLFEWIYQWRGGGYVGFNPIGIELEYDKFGPIITLMVVIMGIGFQIGVLCPWKTEESIFVNQYMESSDIFSIDPEFAKEVQGEHQEVENPSTTRKEE